MDMMHDQGRLHNNGIHELSQHHQLKDATAKTCARHARGISKENANMLTTNDRNQAEPRGSDSGAEGTCKKGGNRDGEQGAVGRRQPAPEPMMEVSQRHSSSYGA